MDTVAKHPTWTTMADTRYELIALNNAFESGFTNALGND